MRKVILYSSRHGFAKRCLKVLNEQCGERYELIDELKKLDLSDIDELLIGGSLYHSRLNKELVYFLEDHVHELCSKKVGLFLIGLKIDRLQKSFELNFPKVLLDRCPRIYFGGSTNTTTLNIIEKMKMKQIIKKYDYESNDKDMIRLDNITRLLNRVSSE